MTRQPPSFCGCVGTVTRAPLSRRRALGAALTAVGAGMAIGMLPHVAMADEGDYDAMLLTCIDPRFVGKAHKFMADHQWQGRYSHFAFAGAAIGAVAPAFAGWHETFWDNLATSIQLHHIKSVVALDHRDCGAAKIAYGEDTVATAKMETEAHRKALAEFRKQVAQRHAGLQVITGLMALGGGIEMLG